MKNVIITILALTTVVAGYFVVKERWKMRLDVLEGKTEKLFRGDLTLPINATGEVRPYRRVQIKSEASGEVLAILKRPGDPVEFEERLIQLKEDDEERNRDRAEQDLVRADAQLQTARINLEQAQTADLEAARAQVVQLEQAVRLAKYRKGRLGDANKEGAANPEELEEVDVACKTKAAQLDAAKADLERAKLAIPRAEQDVKRAEAAYAAAQKNLEDAKERFEETKILAPTKGIVGNVFTQEGEVIQGGKTTFTGGTLLATVLDMRRVIVGAEVDESDIEQVRKLAPEWAKPGHDRDERMPGNLKEAAGSVEHLASITVESFRDEKFEGVIERIYPEPRTVSGVVTYLVDVVVTSENREKLLPGMRADVSFTSEHVKDALLCPNEAIRENPKGEGLAVYVPKQGASSSERQTDPVPCKFGLSNGNYSEVLCNDLTEGMEVYTKLPVQTERDKDRKKDR